MNSQVWGAGTHRCEHLSLLSFSSQSSWWWLQEESTCTVMRTVWSSFHPFLAVSDNHSVAFPAIVLWPSPCGQVAPSFVYSDIAFEKASVVMSSGEMLSLWLFPVVTEKRHLDIVAKCIPHLWRALYVSRKGSIWVGFGKPSLFVVFRGSHISSFYPEMVLYGVDTCVLLLWCLLEP